MGSIKNLFAPKSPTPASATPQAVGTTIAPANNPNSKLTGETYTSYGKRMCGLTNASSPALSPFINKIYISEKNRQLGDPNVQAQLKQQMQNKIAQQRTKEAQQKNNLDRIQTLIAQAKDNIQKFNNEISQLKIDAGHKNKEAKTRMWIGAIILFPLTVYLFMFYSSAIYSAFFMDGVTIDLATAMLNPQALQLAWNAGFQEFLFVLLMPIIFLGLGFILHYYSNEKKIGGYLKAGLVLLITFAFDCILAYKIGESIYNYQSLTQLASLPPYGLGIATKDITFWAVIFCGFIAYIIWGLIFGLAYSAYEDIVSNKHEIEAIEKKIHREEKNINDLGQQETDMKNDILKTQGEIQQLESVLSRGSIFNPTEIKTCISDFFTGWISVMAALGRTPEEQDGARAIYESCIHGLFE